MTAINKIAIVHPALKAGGSEARAMVLLEALQDDYETTLVTGAPFECMRLNKAYHTNVDESRIEVEVAPMPRIIRDAASGDALRGAFLGRFVRRIGKNFALCISTYNFTDFGRPSIQFIADFSWDDEIRREFDPLSPGVRGLVQKRNLLRSAYLGVANLIRGGRFELRHHDKDVIIANSHWTARILKERHGLSSRVIYPPVYAPPVKATKRSGDFVMLGRIEPDKRVTEAIDILSRVRQRGYHFHFHIIGPLDESAYCNQVREKARAHGDWVRLLGGLYGQEKYDELGKYGFAIHTRKREAFGIAVAEMVKMGVIPFVPAHTAPAEIVGEQRLLYLNEEDAVEKICRVLSDESQQQDLHRQLKNRAEQYSTEQFSKQIRRLVEKWCDG